MGYKLLAIDIDGTLLDDNREIRPRVKMAIRAAAEAGCTVTLATGRRHRPAREIAHELDINTPLILYCGSIVYDIQTEKALYHKPLKPEYIENAIGLIRQAGYRPVILQSPLSGEFIYTGPPEDDDEFLKEYAEHPQRRDLMVRTSYAEMPKIADPLTVVGIGPKMGFGDLQQAVENRLQCNIFSYPLWIERKSDLHGFDFVQPGVGKGVALAALAAHLGLEMSQTLAIGDSLNDLDMLKVAGLSVAMGNATPELKKVSHAIVGSNNEDGVAEAIERFVLE